MQRILLTILSGITLGVLGTYALNISHIFIPLSYQAHFWLLSGLMLVNLFLILAAVRQLAIKDKYRKAHLRQVMRFIRAKLHDKEKRFKSVFDITSLGMATVDLDGRLREVNPSFCELLGYKLQDMQALNFFHLVESKNVNELQICIQRLIDNDIKSYQAEQQWFRKNGEAVWVTYLLTLIRNDKNQPAYFILQIQNITMQKKAEERLRHMAYHDHLTGLANRNKLEQCISHILATARRHKQSFALLFLDLDRFKNINDTVGHDAGDLLLQVIAERLKNSVRETDMVARLGGDEFVLLITDVKKTESVALIAQKILDSVRQVVTINGQEIYITTSVGLSIFPHDGQNMQALMKNADLALYRAKEQGRNNYQFYTVEMTGKAQEKLALQNTLGHALAKEEFLLYYQPKMELKTRRITGVEVLLRWKNKTYSTISPSEIIALAEETGFIIPISEWVLKSACQQLKAWHDMGLTSLTLSLNCTARQFKQSTFVDNLTSVIKESGVRPELIEIEIVESVIMQDTENALRVLEALKDLGIQIAIDDFGTGYWSLSNLRRLSIDKIKIDKSFIKSITKDEMSSSLVSATIAMANKLGIKSIAEGVETREQYDILAREGCTEIQGYYLTQPLSPDLMTAFLNHPIPDAETINKDEFTN